MYTLQATDIDNGGEFFRKLNANFAEAANPQSSHTDAECRTRFVQEMNKKAAELGMSNTTYNDPAGDQPQPASTVDPTQYPQLFQSDPNTMSAYDALRCMLYATQYAPIVSASRMDSFTLTYKRNGTVNTTTITHSDSMTTQSASLVTDYDMLLFKGGTYGLDKKWFSVMIVARSKATGKVYAIVDMNTTTGETASDNKYVQCKKVLDYVDGQTGTAPTFSRGGIVCISMPQFSPTLWNLFDWANRVDVDNDPLVLFSYSKDFVGHPCSMTKVMTAILLCENYVNLNQVVTVHESDRQPPSGFDFKAGDQVRLSDFVKCLMVQSSNTSAHVIARVVGGLLLDKDANVLS